MAEPSVTPSSPSTSAPFRTVAVLTLGCKLNQAESEAIARELTAHGCRVVDRPSAADAYVINSCSVTHVADRKSRHLVRLARRLAPAATVLLTGCYPETAGIEIARATGADIVVPSRDKAEVVRRLLAWAPSGADLAPRLSGKAESPPTPRHGALAGEGEHGGRVSADDALPVEFVQAGDGGLAAGETVPPSAQAADRSGAASAGRDLDDGIPPLHPTSQTGGEGAGLRTRAFVKAQEGCNDVCAFCIVPRTRGRERSIPPLAVAAEVAAREAAGAREVVITGTQLGAYGRDLDAISYGPAAVIRAVLAETSVPRVRFSSLQPQDITPALLALWDDPRLCRHFHLALQSGSDSVLRRMRRRYTIDGFRRALELIRAYVPDVAITTDVIVGFPGETDVEAEESLVFCREAGFTLMHVFPYSRRPGTTAHLLKEHVPEPVKRARMQAMLALARESAAVYRRHYLGRVMPVLWEGRLSRSERLRLTGEGPDTTPLWEGLTDNYIRVFTRSTADLWNRILPTRLSDEAADGVWGEVEIGAVAHADTMRPLPTPSMDPVQDGMEAGSVRRRAPHAHGQQDAPDSELTIIPLTPREWP